MAMPSELPPPLDDTEAQPAGWTDAEIFAFPSPAASLTDEPKRLADYVLELAQQMAESVGDQIGDVLRRTKSRNWMLGTLRRRTSGRHSDEEIRDAISAASRQHRPTNPDELERRRVDLTSRRAPKGLEPNHDPCWGVRSEQLGTIVVYPMTVRELQQRASLRLGWSQNFIKQTTAAAEEANELWYDRAFGHWHRTAERIVMADPKKKTLTKRTQRHLPVELKADDQEALKQRIRDIDAEREALEGELTNETKRLRAAIKGRLDAREGVIEALKTGREVQLVDCEERFAYEQREVVTVRKDTGAVVERREMRPDELQTTIPETASAS